MRRWGTLSGCAVSATACGVAVADAAGVSWGEAEFCWAPSFRLVCCGALAGKK